MNRIIWVLLAFAATPLAAVAEDGVQIPWGNKFFVPKDPPPVVVHDFGTVPWGTTLTHRFNITNIYAVPMQIVEDPKVSCGCVRIVRYTQKLAPRETGFVEIEMDGRRFEGAKAVTITARFGPQYQSTAILQVRAFGRTDVTLKPGQINFGVVAQGQQPAQIVEIAYKGQQINWQIGAIDTSNAPSVIAQIQRLPAAAGGITYRLTATLKAEASSGVLQEQIFLKTNDPASPVLSIPISGAVHSPLQVVQGPIVKLESVAVGEETVKIIMVRGNKPFQINDVIGQGDGLTVKYQRFPLFVQNVTITFKPTQAGELRRRLTITTDQKESTSVVIEGVAEPKEP